MRRLAGCLCVALAGLPGPARTAGPRPAGYRAARDAAAPAIGAPALLRDSLGTRFTIGWRSAGSQQGLLSIGGLPPVPGALSVTDGSLVFHPLNGTGPVAYALYRRTGSAEHPWRESAVDLLDVAAAGPDTLFVFHLDGAVLETASPGLLRDILADRAQLDSLGAPWTTAPSALADPRDTTAQLTVLRDLVATTYADTLFRVFGTPARPLGLVGDRGRRAGRLGEFITSRDSISLAPARMVSGAQLRHALAHELAHRWQRAEPDEVAGLWRGVPSIHDSLRYGYHNTDEHQAEAVAFAVHFLQTTASPDVPSADALELLDAYERLVPGTHVMARRLLAESPYRGHPLASVLLAPRALALSSTSEQH